MASQIVDSNVLKELLTTDPGLPRNNPTKSYWQHIPHTLAEIQSPSLPENTDVLIIGSGITGTSVAKHLLEGQPDTRVTIVEARTLCSGATGRNGGQLVTFGAAGYLGMKKAYGKEMAMKMLKFFWDTRDAVLQEANRYAPEESEIRTVTRVRAFQLGDESSLDEVKKSVAEFEEDFPEAKGQYKFIVGEQAQKDYGLYGVVGAVLFKASCLWPYRFVMRVLEQLKIQYGSRLLLESKTPVTKVEYTPETNQPHPYSVHTPRGIIRSSHVVYCTNGYSSHLLPEIRGRLFPKRATMSVQDFDSGMPNQGNLTSWNFHHKPRYDEKVDAIIQGYYYMQQNPHSGYFFLGGEAQNAFTTLTSDDANVSPVSVENLQKVLPEFFGQDSSASNKLISSWNGIMGYTADHLPLVGKLPGSLTLREGDREWIAAGFNGGGMCQCWLAGRAIAQMICGEGVSNWFPETFGLSSERLQTRLTTEKSVNSVDYLLLQKMVNQ